MANTSKSSKFKFLPSDWRDSRATWLSRFYAVDLYSRVKCSDVLNDLTEKFPNISKRECGFIVRRFFPSVRRKHSNHVYYYSGIRRVSDPKSLNGGSFDDGSFEKEVPVLEEVNHDIPKSLHVKRQELIDVHDTGICKFNNGIVETLQLKRFRGFPVAVRECEHNIESEVKSILRLPSHPSLPIVLGICLDCKPFLLVTKFYGSSKFGVMLSLYAAIKDKCKDSISKERWISIIHGITEGLLHMHANAFCHGDLQSHNIILHRKSRENKFLQPVFFSLDKALHIKKENTILFRNDVQNLASLIDNISANTKGDNLFKSVADIARGIDQSSSNSIDVLKHILHHLKQL
ncbi:uncharacterized protein LOC114535141 [Dendronephthya gigantea]|uniref:uncharacterized protein LOC114535141 n=1 Tax=Dendronephthya gigantea TaxID=151771 RepID=UPI001069D02F|nr:uncharacterized protein LOC114535141 [Dendronephthya gigantea]